MRARLQKLIDVLATLPEGNPALRRAALSRASSLAGGALPADEAVPEALVGWVERVAREAWKVTDADVAALRSAGVDEDTIFEATVATAVGAAVGRYQVAERAIEAARSAPAAEGSG